MPFKVANSSFIFDLLLRSITLWAVFLAIFLPAALVEVGCFFVVAAALDPDRLRLFDPFAPGCDECFTFSGEGCDFGVI